MFEPLRSSSLNRKSSFIIHHSQRPAAQGRSEIFPALNRLLIPVGNVQATAAKGPQTRDIAFGDPTPGTETAPSRFAPEPPLSFSASSRAACDLPRRCGRSREEADGPERRCPVARMQGGADVCEHARSE